MLKILLVCPSSTPLRLSLDDIQSSTSHVKSNCFPPAGCASWQKTSVLNETHEARAIKAQYLRRLCIRIMRSPLSRRKATGYPSNLEIAFAKSRGLSYTELLSSQPSAYYQRSELLHQSSEDGEALVTVQLIDLFLLVCPDTQNQLENALGSQM